ncbi:MAG: dihydrofolate reductase [Sphingomonadaceae bacterium]|nr:dihydrofolate reductase [Sphingomonadaceae bacterium]
MQPIIYDVAVSIDGFIAGPDGDISKFPEENAVIDDYYARLNSYGCAIMGRATYELGYRFGLKPGDNPYPGLETYIFSATIELPADNEVTVVRSAANDLLKELRRVQSAPIYLCGGGAFAGSLLANGAIDMLRLKRAPIILGGGIELFGGERAAPDITLTDSKHYANGHLFQQFEMSNRA